MEATEGVVRGGVPCGPLPGSGADSGGLRLETSAAGRFQAASLSRGGDGKSFAHSDKVDSPTGWGSRGT
jgi:hypothetical protein